MATRMNRRRRRGAEALATLPTHERLVGLSADARHVYDHILRLWLMYGEYRWSRRDLYQQLKGATRFRTVAGVEAPLVELAEAGLLLRHAGSEESRELREAARLIGVQYHGPSYSLLVPVLPPPPVPVPLPVHRHGNSKGPHPLVHHPTVHAPPLPSPPDAVVATQAPQAAGNTTPPTRSPQCPPDHRPATIRQTRAEELAWRVEVLWRQVVRTGRLAQFRVREVRPDPGSCDSCGERLSPGDGAYCSLCMEALRVVVARIEAHTRP